MKVIILIVTGIILGIIGLGLYIAFKLKDFFGKQLKNN
jgi:uncharacterized protein YneF (UPF0154 family)